MPDSPYTDLSRPPLNQAALRRAVLRPGALWTELRVVPRTASTNADLVASARQGAAEGTVLVAEQQVAGRGRLGRRWDAPARAGLTLSVVLRPGEPVPARGWPAVPSGRYGWLPLLAGVALADTVRRLGEVDAVLKWPNDLLVAGAKCAGILAEAVPDGPAPAVVLGIGLNVSQDRDELPRADATSLAIAGSGCLDRDPLLRALLRELADRYTDWRASAGDPVASRSRERYAAGSDTLGRRVRVLLPGGGDLVGDAVDIDAQGRLVVDSGTRTAVAAGDIVHLR
ncbi:MAG TPA: biotin--[acetyl-CoA-carboxylase] ligase [Micromonosporaceae bacterium]